uniref:Uncharacterized protein n=1 Tax=Globodera rostochiensis TaxID=31243 RepID=A0A914HBK7_GLORO
MSCRSIQKANFLGMNCAAYIVALRARNAQFAFPTSRLLDLVRLGGAEAFAARQKRSMVELLRAGRAQFGEKNTGRRQKLIHQNNNFA